GRWCPARASGARLPAPSEPTPSTTRNPHVSARVAVSRPRERAAAVWRCACASIVRIVTGSRSAGRFLELWARRLLRPFDFLALEFHRGDPAPQPTRSTNPRSSEGAIRLPGGQSTGADRFSRRLAQRGAVGHDG